MFIFEKLNKIPIKFSFISNEKVYLFYLIFFIVAIANFVFFLIYIILEIIKLKKIEENYFEKRKKIKIKILKLFIYSLSGFASLAFFIGIAYI